MDQNVSIEEVLNNSFATIYDVLKVVDSNINDVVINNLNNNATEDEILRLKQFNEDYIKAMQKTKSLQSDITELFSYVNKDINEIKTEEMQQDYVQENVGQMGDMVTEEMIPQEPVATEEMMDDFGPMPVTEQPVVDDSMDMVNTEEVPVDEMAVENTEEVTAEDIAGGDEVTAEDIAGVEEVPTDGMVEENVDEATAEEIAGVTAEEVTAEEIAGETAEEATAEEIAGETAEEATAEEIAGETAEEATAEEIAGVSGEEVPVEENPEITFNEPTNLQESDGAVLPSISLGQDEAPVEASEEVPAEAVEANADDGKLKLYKTSNEPAKVILVTNPQNDKLKQSLATQQALLNAKGLFMSDNNLEEQLVQNGLLEGTIEEKQQQIQQLITEAQELYKEGKNEEAQEKMNLVSQLNEQIKGETQQQENVMAA